MTSLTPTIEAGVHALGQTVESGVCDRLAAYVALLARWNRAYNLSAVREPAAMVERHILDCLAIRPWLRGASLLDLGSGAGLPGLVVAISDPAMAVTLLDSKGKKTRFLHQAVIELGLTNVTVQQARAETLPPGRFETITARAFTDLAALWRWGSPSLVASGVLLAMKGRRPDDELAALSPTCLTWETCALSIPGLEAQRHLVIMRSLRGHS